MPRMRVNGADLYYEDTGAGPETAVFAHEPRAARGRVRRI
jgi:hypothetical protein